MRVGVPRRQRGCQTQCHLRLRRLVAIMPRLSSALRLVALPRRTPHSTFLIIHFTLERDCRNRLYMVHHLHLQNHILLRGVVANKVLHPVLPTQDHLKKPFLVRFSPDWSVLRR